MDHALDEDAHLQSAKRLLASSHADWVLPEHEAAAELALATGHPEHLRLIVDNPPDTYPVFVVPLLVLVLRAEADLADQARAGQEQAAEQEAINRAQALLSQALAMGTPETWPLGSPPPEIVLALELCALDAGRARGEKHADAWAAHAARWDELGRPPRAAYARVREADSALVENLPRTRVAAALAAARATATRLGARPLLDEIDLVSRRARVRRAADDPEEEVGDAAGLTAREQDVLRLIAEGRTNPEIGKAVYMSPKTASVHVSRILSKLDVKTRTEAAGLAHRLGLLDTSQHQTTT